MGSTKAAFRKSPHCRFWSAYNESKAFKIDACTFRAWILSIKGKFEKMVEVEREKKLKEK